MANDRIYLVCPTCQQKVTLLRYYPSENEAYTPVGRQELDDFLCTHLFSDCNPHAYATTLATPFFELHTEAILTKDTPKTMASLSEAARDRYRNHEGGTDLTTRLQQVERICQDALPDYAVVMILIATPGNPFYLRADAPLILPSDDIHALYRLCTTTGDLLAPKLTDLHEHMEWIETRHAGGGCYVEIDLHNSPITSSPHQRTPSKRFTLAEITHLRELTEGEPHG